MAKGRRLDKESFVVAIYKSVTLLIGSIFLI